MIFYLPQPSQKSSGNYTINDQRLLCLLKLFDIPFKIENINSIRPQKYLPNKKKGVLLISVVQFAKLWNSKNHWQWIEDNYNTVESWFKIAKIYEVPIYIDWSWEVYNFVEISQPAFQRVRNLLLEYNAKFITNNIFGDIRFHPTRLGQKIKLKWDKIIVDEELIKKIIHPFQLFPYDTRGVSHMNNLYNLNTFTTKNKKYEFSALFGEIKKPQNNRLVLEFHKRNLIDKCFYSMVWSKYEPSGWHDALLETIEIYSDVIGDKDIHDFIYHKPFDDNHYKPSDMQWPFKWTPATHEERRIPQEVHESHFNIAIETTTNSYFYTEKIYKFIAHTDDPWIIYVGGDPFYHIEPNKKFKKEFGFELFEEIFDYSFEGVKYNEKLRMARFCDEIERVIKEPKSIFSQPSVLEKIRHNKNVFAKMSTKDSLIKQIEGLL